MNLVDFIVRGRGGSKRRGEAQKYNFCCDFHFGCSLEDRGVATAKILGGPCKVTVTSQKLFKGYSKSTDVYYWHKLCKTSASRLF